VAGGWGALSVISVLLLLLAGILAGMVNAVAGGGTFLVFGALTLTGLPPISANATSSIVQFPGYITSTLAYWADIRRLWRVTLPLAVASVVGGLVGSLILLTLDNAAFRLLVPWLLVAATVLFAVGPWLRPRPRTDGGAAPHTLTGIVVQFLTSIYGGFFGAGMGVVMLATLGLTQPGDYHRLNAMKNLLAAVIATTAIVVFVSGGVIGWLQTLIMAPGVALGGYGGVWVARHLPQLAIRIFVIAVGAGLALYYFIGG
jgi:uncharacterized protein